MSCAKHGPVDPPPTPGVDTTSHTITWTHTTMGDIFYGAFAIGGKYFLVGYNGFNAEITVGQREGK